MRTLLIYEAGQAGLASGRRQDLCGIDRRARLRVRRQFSVLMVERDLCSEGQADKRHETERNRRSPLESLPNGTKTTVYRNTPAQGIARGECASDRIEAVRIVLRPNREGRGSAQGRRKTVS